MSPRWISDVGHILIIPVGSRQLRKSRSDPRSGVKSLELVVSSSKITLYVRHPDGNYEDQVCRASNLAVTHRITSHPRTTIAPVDSLGLRVSRIV